ncbi:MAG TPA: tripartite tricarboxylate transporter substrate binding protein [Xanthobacteraceae bacterium]|jgi:tripartite-type tricarboxylate transporter receptor subunit TctC
MSQIRRHRGICAAAIIAVLHSSSPSDAQPWPQRTVRAIVPFPPGSSPDIVARVFAERLAARWGQAVVVENLPGAEGFTGTTTFAAARDDHALLFAPAAPIAVYPLLHEKLSYDPARDIVPVAAITNTFGAIAVPASLQAATLPELVEYARARPGKLNWATGGGAFPVLMSGFVKAAGLEITQVPYRNQNLALQDLAEARIQVVATAMTVLSPLAQAGKIRVLTVTNKARSALWPDIPTVAESGYPDFTFEGLIGVFAPGGTPDDRRNRISIEIRQIAAGEAVDQRLRATGQLLRPSAPSEFTAAIEEQRSKLAAIIRIVGKPTN